MSASENSDAGPDTPVIEGGVLGALPRTRPQRASARRAAARGKAVKSETVARKSKAKAPTKSKPETAKKPRATKKPAAKRVGKPPAPRQGYEAEDEVELGNTVNPPSGVELLESIGDIVGELAGSSLTAGGRLLKDAFSILRRP
jgi:hypothetical protein